MNDDYRASWVWINMCSPWEERKMSLLGLELVNIDSFCADDKLVFWKNAPAWFAAFAQWNPWNTNFSRWCQLYAIRGSNLCHGISNGILKQIAVLLLQVFHEISLQSYEWNAPNAGFVMKSSFPLSLCPAHCSMTNNQLKVLWREQLSSSHFQARPRSILAWMDKRPRERGYSISSDQCKSYMLRLTWNFDVTWLYSFQCLLPLTITDILILIWY